MSFYLKMRESKPPSKPTQQIPLSFCLTTQQSPISLNMLTKSSIGLGPPLVVTYREYAFCMLIASRSALVKGQSFPSAKAEPFLDCVAFIRGKYLGISTDIIILFSTCERQPNSTASCQTSEQCLCFVGSSVASCAGDLLLPRLVAYTSAKSLFFSVALYSAAYLLIPSVVESFSLASSIVILGTDALPEYGLIIQPICMNLERQAKVYPVM